MDIGARLRKLRKSKNLTEQNLADLTNISQPVINRLENNAKVHDVESINRICSVYGMSLSDFFTGEELSLPPDIWELVKNTKNYDMLRLIIALKNEGISNDLIYEMIKSISNTLRVAKREGVYWAADEVTEEQKDKAERFRRKIKKSGFKPGEDTERK